MSRQRPKEGKQKKNVDKKKRADKKPSNYCDGQCYQFLQEMNLLNNEEIADILVEIDKYDTNELLGRFPQFSLFISIHFFFSFFSVFVRRANTHIRGLLCNYIKMRKIKWENAKHA